MLALALAMEHMVVRMAGLAKIAVLVTGRPAPAVELQHGGFAAQITTAIGPSWPGGYQLIDAERLVEQHPVLAPAAVVITGSPASVHHRTPWMQAAEAWVRALLAREVPVFGICFGHQLIAQALGGTVRPNPQGREVGTVRIERRGHDPLLSALPPSFDGNCYHDDTVGQLPVGAQVLAHSARDAHQCVRFGRACYGVQFHPEFDGAIMGAYVRARGGELARLGLDPARLLARADDATMGREVLRRFVARFVPSAAPRR